MVRERDEIQKGGVRREKGGKKGGIGGQEFQRQERRKKG